MKIKKHVGAGTPPKTFAAAATPTKFVDRDLCSIDPCKQQFEPTAASPVPQRYKMAGGA